MHHLFLDESGEFGQASGSSKHLLIAILFPSDNKKLKNAVKREKKRLHDLGWPRSLEIKGSTLYGCHREPLVPAAIANNRIDYIKRIIEKILGSGATPHYSIIRKAGLKPHLLNAPYGIAYNYFAGCLLCKLYPTRINGPVSLVVDQRSKETHHQLPFDGYIRTRIIADCAHEHDFIIQHEESDKFLGLQAADFISWGLFRHYEHGDSTFRDIIRPKVGVRDNWFA